MFNLQNLSTEELQKILLLQYELLDKRYYEILCLNNAKMISKNDFKIEQLIDITLCIATVTAGETAISFLHDATKIGFSCAMLTLIIFLYSNKKILDMQQQNKLQLKELWKQYPKYRGYHQVGLLLDQIKKDKQIKIDQTAQLNQNIILLKSQKILLEYFPILYFL